MPRAGAGGGVSAASATAEVAASAASATGTHMVKAAEKAAPVKRPSRQPLAP